MNVATTTASRSRDNSSRMKRQTAGRAKRRQPPRERRASRRPRREQRRRKEPTKMLVKERRRKKIPVLWWEIRFVRKMAKKTMESLRSQPSLANLQRVKRRVHSRLQIEPKRPKKQISTRKISKTKCPPQKAGRPRRPLLNPPQPPRMHQKRPRKKKPLELVAPEPRRPKLLIPKQHPQRRQNPGEVNKHLEGI